MAEFLQLARSDIKTNHSVKAPEPKSIAQYEWQTFALIIAIYAAWFLLLQNYHLLGAVVAIPILVIIVTLFGSVSHEVIHGHPTRNAVFNRMLVSIPLTVFLPYPIYRDSHLRHHQDENITLPGIDPESYYCRVEDYNRKSAPAKVFAWFNMTIVGRLLCHPAVEILQLGQDLFKALYTMDSHAIRDWIIHLASVAILLLLVKDYFEVAIWQYLIVAYLAGATGRIRSFYEHRAHSVISERTVLMDAGFFFRMLYLNLNYHLAHHENPSLPWYQLGDYYNEHRTDLIARSGNFHYRGYKHWLTTYLFRPVTSPIHPFDQQHLRERI